MIKLHKTWILKPILKRLNSLTIISSKERDFCNKTSSAACITRNWTAHKSWALVCHLQVWVTLNSVCQSGSLNQQDKQREGRRPGLFMKVWHKVAWPAIRWYKGSSSRPSTRTNQVPMLDMSHTQLQRQLFQANYSWWKRTQNYSFRTKTFRCKWKTCKLQAWDQITPKAIS